MRLDPPEVRRMLHMDARVGPKVGVWVHSLLCGVLEMVLEVPVALVVLVVSVVLVVPVVLVMIVAV